MIITDLLGDIQRTFYLVYLATIVYCRNILLLLFPILAIACYFLLGTLVVSFLYYYDITIFDPKAIRETGLISLFWDVGIIFVLFVSPCYFLATICKSVAKLSTIFALVNIMHKGKPELFRSLQDSFKHIKIILQYAYVTTMVVIFGEAELKRYLKDEVSKLGAGEFIIVAHTKRWFEQTFVVLPVIAFEQLTLPQAFKKSDLLINQYFGNNCSARFSFFNLIILLNISVAGFISWIASYFYSNVVAIVIFFAISIVILCLISCAEVIFQTAVYNYCVNKPTGIFKKSDIENSFRQAD